MTGSAKLLVFIICVNHKLRFAELSLNRVNIFQDAVSCLMLEFEAFKVKIRIERINPHMDVLRVVAEINEVNSSWTSSTE